MAKKSFIGHSGYKVSCYSFFIACCLIMSSPLLGQSYSSGDLKISFGTTVSYGIGYRIEDRDPDIIGYTNKPGGVKAEGAWSVNGDDGNLNYDKGVYSNVAKLSTEMELKYNWFGAFFRARGFYDYENEKGDRARTPLTDAALERVGSRAELMDAFLSASFSAGKVPVEFRVGQQVLSWGESTFIQNGINVINPIDVSAFRVPGAELKEGLMPEQLAWLSLGLSENTTFEAFYQFRWSETEIDPAGSYFSTQDLVGAGSTKVMLSFGAVPDFVNPGDGVNAPVGGAVGRGEDVKASDTGQYGAAYRFLVPALNDTEFGLYYINYHNRVPVISGHTGLANFHGDYAGTATYFLEYLEDIKLYGGSFNASIGTFAVQGEISHRQDLPVQVDDVELLFAALSPLAALEDNPSVFTLLASTNQLGAYGFDEYIPGYIRRDMTQYQMTVTKVVGSLLGADQGVLVWEGALSQFHDLPDKAVLRLDGPGTYVTGNEIHAAVGVQPGVEGWEHFADPTSYGYRLAGRLEYNNAMGGINLSPYFSWQHDLKGVSPGPGGNFLEGRKALTVGVTGVFQNSWSADFGYTTYSGAGRYNLINDRDFVSFNMKYSF